jgi:oligogalacturonide lyase
MAETGPRAEVGGTGLLSRRAWFAALAGPLAAQNAAPAPEWRKYLDPATEFEVLLLTDPQFESRFPSPPAIAVDRRSRLLLYASNRTGQWQPWAMDLTTGLSRQLGSHASFARETLTLSATGREAMFADGGRILAVTLTSLRQRTLATLAAEAECASPLAPSVDGASVFFSEKRSGTWRLQRLDLARGGLSEVASASEPILLPAPNPRRAMVLWLTAGGEVEAAAFDGTMRRKLETPGGRVLEAHWSPDGQSVVYLHESAEEKPRTTIREQRLDSREDRLVAPTSQFGRFSRNANGTVFVGASRSLASPLILVLLRINRREFSLCEHRAAEVSLVTPIFTPDSQKILFVSDRLGKPAIFLMNVEKLIEKTDT